MAKTPITLDWRDCADFTRMMIELANRRRLAMRGMSKRAAFRYLETIVADAEVVIGIWQDVSEPQQRRPACDQGPLASHDQHCQR
jgi:hypothetical protein